MAGKKFFKMYFERKPSNFLKPCNILEMSILQKVLNIEELQTKDIMNIVIKTSTKDVIGSSETLFIDAVSPHYLQMQNSPLGTNMSTVQRSDLKEKSSSSLDTLNLKTLQKPKENLQEKTQHRIST